MADNKSPQAQQRRWLSDVGGRGLVIVLLPLLILVGVAYLVVLAVLHLIVWVTWLPRGRKVLFVYSNSPVWQAYIEAHVIPRLPAQTLILNWSERSRWRRLSFAVILWRVLAGDSNHNPVAIVFSYFRVAKVIRFYAAFRDYKHGKGDALESAEAKLMQAIAS